MKVSICTFAFFQGMYNLFNFDVEGVHTGNGEIYTPNARYLYSKET